MNLWMRRTSDKRTLTLLAFAFALCLVLDAVEEFYLPVIPLPGVRFGLASLPLLLFVDRLRPADIVTVQLLRIFASALLFKGFNPVSLALSLSGGVAAVVVLLLAVRLPAISLAGTGSLMAAAHISAQFAAAALLLGTVAVFIYLPLSGTISVLAGFTTGMLANSISARYQRLL